MGIEKGYKFSPTDEELMRCLLNRVTGSRSLAWRCDGLDVIGTADLYGSDEPWEVFGGDWKEKERVFFTELRRVGKNRRGRICRNVGKGVWMNKGQRTWIRGKNGIIGYKRGFRYERKKGNSSDLGYDWLLKEYIVSVRVKEKYANSALCVLKRRRKKKNSASGGGLPPTEEEITAAAEIEVTDEFLRRELGDDDLIPDDDAPAGDRAAVDSVPIVVDDCMQEEDDDHRAVIEEVNCWLLDDDDRRAVIEEDECSTVPVEGQNQNMAVTSAVIEDDDRAPVVIGEEECSAADDVEEECSILAHQKEDFDFVDYRYDHFDPWAVFGDPWAVTQQQMQMLPVV